MKQKSSAPSEDTQREKAVEAKQNFAAYVGSVNTSFSDLSDKLKRHERESIENSLAEAMEFADISANSENTECSDFSLQQNKS
jgi:molecular chaperone DnaK (HSP70)